MYKTCLTRNKCFKKNAHSNYVLRLLQQCSAPSGAFQLQNFQSMYKMTIYGFLINSEFFDIFFKFSAKLW